MLNAERSEVFEQVRDAVDQYQNHMDLLSSIHKECGTEWNWRAILEAPAPARAVPQDTYESGARRSLDRYRPSLFDRLLGRTTSKIDALKRRVEEARRRDKEDARQAAADYQSAKNDWLNSRKFARRILDSDLEAYAEAIKETNPFNDLSCLGSSLQFEFPRSHPHIIKGYVRVNGDRAVPKFVLTQLKDGSLSKRPMPTTRFHEIYQDYVCGCVLRVAREVFALLPVKMVIVTANGELLNTKTGHLEEKPILSAAIPRTTLSQINWETIDPSDTMTMFVHRMCFKKSKGLFEIEPIQVSELSAK